MLGNHDSEMGTGRFVVSVLLVVWVAETTTAPRTQQRGSRQLASRTDASHGRSTPTPARAGAAQSPTPRPFKHPREHETALRTKARLGEDQATAREDKNDERPLSRAWLTEYAL